MSHCVHCSPHRARTSPFNVSDFLLWPECPLTLSRWQLTASAASVCCSAFTTTLQSSVPASDWTAGLHPRFPLVHPSPSCGQCPLTSRPLMSIQTGDRASPEHNIAQFNFEHSRVENGNVAKSLNFKGSISVYLGLGPKDSDFLSRIILRLRSRVRLRQPGRAMETSRHSGSGADLKWMVRDCEEVKMLKSVQLCNYVESWGQRFRQVSGGLWSWHLVSGEGAMMCTEAFLCITMIMMTIILVNFKSSIGQWHETPSLCLIWH